MRGLRRTIALALIVGIGLVGASSAAAAAPVLPNTIPGLGLLHLVFKRVCTTPSAGHAACNAIAVTGQSSTGQPAPLVSPSLAPLALPAGYGPSDLVSAYNLPTTAVAGTVALVDAYDDPSAAGDLAAYRNTYGLPPCGTGCFSKVSQTGSTTSLPKRNAGWSQEESLDVDMVSAICPSCHIILVEATSPSFANLGAAVNEAAQLGATEISNSYGGSEFSGEQTYSSSYYDHPGIDVTVSSGDGGYGVEFPAASQYVTAVGGTTLTQASGTARGWTEAAWSGAGSGCSAYVLKQPWQTDAGCARRTVADVSAEADPHTGVAVYDTYAGGGWQVFGGTSVAAPIIASVDALAGGRAGTPSAPTFGSYAYVNPGQFNDVTSGSNGSCGGSYLCTAVAGTAGGVSGYDGPTGIGTPNGAGPVGPAEAPVNTQPPVISGPLVQGQTLSATTGSWNNRPTSFAYQWSACTMTALTSCTAVGGATNSTYLLPSGYIGYVSVAVTASNVTGSATSSADPVGPVSAAPLQSFSLSPSPTSQSITRGKSTTYKISVIGSNGFAGAVSLTASGLPAGVTATFSPSTATTVTPSTLTLKSTTSSPTGAHAIGVTGTSGSGSGTLSGSTSVNLTLNSCTLFCF